MKERKIKKKIEKEILENGKLEMENLENGKFTVLPEKNVRGRFPAFLAFKATDQRHIIILLFETLQFWF